jgi:hypothetical protein
MLAHRLAFQIGHFAGTGAEGTPVFGHLGTRLAVGGHHSIGP